MEGVLCQSEPEMISNSFSIHPFSPGLNGSPHPFSTKVVKMTPLPGLAHAEVGCQVHPMAHGKAQSKHVCF